ncbi:MAG: 2-oxo acid dehydrogenase subunit E2 [Chloroflexi bacterium]|nr:2-oxo acid dehydrogenase subunit E2 [Chloroflexota bacterium]
MSDRPEPEAAAGRHPVSQSPMRRAIARRMVESKQQIPHFYLSTEIEMDALLAIVDAANADRAREDRVTVTAYLLRAVALTLAEHPAFNATWNGSVIEQVDAINIGVAIALDDGLIAPALLDCREREVADLATGLADLVARTRAGKLRAAEIGEGTFTLSNLGMFEITSFTAIVTPPQVAILATARTVERPVVRDGAVAIRRIMTATLSSDHRVVDGVAAARFLATLKGLIEAPDVWTGDGA